MSSLAGGLGVAFEPQALLFIAIGTVIGLIVGAAPGLGPTIGMAVMLPFALTLTPEHAIFLLVAIFVGSNFGNAIPAILIRVPGTPSALLTVVEGYPFHEKGEGGRALLIALVSSFLCQVIGIFLFIAFVIPLAQVAVRFLFPEVFAITIFGLVAAIGLIGTSVAKGFVAIALGLALSFVGQDPVLGIPRFAFGTGELAFGLPIVPVIVGLLAFREVFSQVERIDRRPAIVMPFKLEWLSKADWKAITLPLIIGGVVGTIGGAIPGAGVSLATFITYQVMKVIGRNRYRFGKGDPGVLAAVEGSNNAAAAGELIPTFGIGIPGSAPMVVVMAVLSAQGLIVGPALMKTQPELLYATFGGLIAATVMMGVLGYIAIWPSVYVSRLSRPAVATATMVLSVTGIYALRWSLFDVWICLACGVVGYLIARFGYPVAPAALAFILGDLLEANLRRGLVMTHDLAGFLTRPVTAVLLVLAVLMVVLPPVVGWYRGRRDRGDGDPSRA